MEQISCIIPAFNEGPRLRAVLSVIATYPGIDEVIVVNDASTDETGAVAAEFPSVTIITHTENKGKTISLYDGIVTSRHPLLLFIDADLSGLTHDAVAALIAPVQQGKAVMSMSLRGSTDPLGRFIGIDYISGERAIRKEILLPYLPQLLALPRFGFEVFLNSIIIKHHYRFVVIPWGNVYSPFPIQKYGASTGLHRFIGMLRDMVRTVSAMSVIKQYVQMYLLKRKYERS